MEGAAPLPQKIITEEEREEEERKRNIKRQNQSPGFSLSSAFKTVKSEAASSSMNEKVAEPETSNETQMENVEMKNEEDKSKPKTAKEESIPMEAEEDDEDESQLNVVCFHFKIIKWKEIIVKFI